MINKAIEKITKEAMELDHPFGFFIEEHLTEICTSNAVAEKLLAEDKSLREFFKKVTDHARSEAGKTRKNNVGCWGAPDAEFFRQVEEYYGIDSKPAATSRSKSRVNILDMI
jgi:hypothetical protein